VLADSLWAMAVAAQGKAGSPAWGNLPRLAELHSRAQLDIRPELYECRLFLIQQLTRGRQGEEGPGGIRKLTTVPPPGRP
jgi:hypothetical protein